jgi:hypothetical protein
MPIFALIGHRGVGKTSFLRRVVGYYDDAGRRSVAVDLDEELGLRHGAPVSALFEERGEAWFRSAEAEVFLALCEELRSVAESLDVYIALGAGFTFELPADVTPLWIRRPTDAVGRIFLDRPRLDKDLSPLAEYAQRHAWREPRYESICREVWEVPEGLTGPDEAERSFVLGALATPPLPPAEPVGGVLTLLPRHFRSHAATSESASLGWLRRRLSFLGTRFELRDDLLARDIRERVLAELPAERIVYSFRQATPDPTELARIAARVPLWDFALELGEPKAQLAPPILSLHARHEDEDVAAAAQRLTAAGARCGAGILKLAPVVESFREILVGHRWALEDPQRRAFLPRSERSPGRFTWYRLLQAQSQPLAFFREGPGSSPEQPTLAAFLHAGAAARAAAARNASPGFAAVLGDPVLHSRTPIEHRRFFLSRGMPVVAVPMSEEDWREGGIEVLRELGLGYAAVTAPLKRLCAELIGHAGTSTADGGDLSSVNTLFYDAAKRSFVGANTDRMGAAELLRPWRDEPHVAVWGGGGTLPAIAEALPQARFFSVRSGELREPVAEKTAPPRVLVWAAPHSRVPAAPKESIRPEVVVDASYGEDSPGRQYALSIGARYVSGDVWFQRQAEEQRRFWAAAEARITDPAAR